jgi:hypothetical protein
MIRDRRRRRNPAGWVKPALWTAGTLGVFGFILWIMDTEAAKISRLRPEVSALWEKLKAKAAAAGLEIRAISTVRTIDTQKLLVKLGRSAAGISWHNLGRAIDFQVKDPATGKWDDLAVRRDLYLKVARLAEGMGFRQLGFNPDGSRRVLKTADGRTFEDPYHIEYRAPHATIAAAIKAEAPELLTA